MPPLSRPAAEAALAAAGVELPAERMEALLGTYERLAPGLQALYEMPGARYESPALVFEAAPKLERWGPR